MSVYVSPVVVPIRTAAVSAGPFRSTLYVATPVWLRPLSVAAFQVNGTDVGVMVPFSLRLVGALGLVMSGLLTVMLTLLFGLPASVEGLPATS